MESAKPEARAVASSEGRSYQGIGDLLTTASGHNRWHRQSPAQLDVAGLPRLPTLAAMTSTTPTPRPDVTIYHNNRCSNSRGALALLREHGIEPTIIDYIATPLTAPELAELIEHLGVPVRDLLRSKEAEYKELGLDSPAASDVQIIAAVAAHPVLLNRPIVITPKGAALCRPPEKVLALI